MFSLIGALLGSMVVVISSASAFAKSSTPQAESVSAEQNADGELRAKSAGASLIGQKGPKIVLHTIDGKTIDLKKLYGNKPVYLKFWATWCVPCREQMPGLNKIHQKYGKQIEVVAVNAGFSDDLATIRQYRNQYGLHMPIVIDDGSLAQMQNLRVTPMHVVINRDGRIVHYGHLDDQQLEDALKLVLSDTPEASVPTSAFGVQPGPRIGIGQSAQGIVVNTEAGEAIDLGTRSAGKPKALVFFATWCEPYLEKSRPAVSAACQRVRKSVHKLARTGNIQWIGIASGIWTSEGDLQDYKQTMNTTLPLVLDKTGALFGRFGIRQIPSVVLIDSKGKLSKVLGPNERNLEKVIR